MGYKVLDVSEWQGQIYFAKTAKEIQGVIIRVGGTGYGSAHAIYNDDRFEQNYKGFLAQNVPIGIYFYAGAINDAGVDKEIEFIKNRLAGKKIMLPVYYDVECTEGDYYQLSVAERTRLAKRWMDGIRAAGYEPGLYTYLFYAAKLDMTSFAKDTIWMAQYNNTLDYKGICDLWQYTSQGMVSGIGGNADLSLVLNNEWFDHLVKGTEYTPEPLPEEKKGFEVTVYQIEKGDEGNLVKAAQGILYANGYDVGYWGCDGIFGDQTEYATREYQADNGLIADGIIGPLTWGRMLEE